MCAYRISNYIGSLSDQINLDAAISYRNGKIMIATSLKLRVHSVPFVHCKKSLCSFNSLQSRMESVVARSCTTTFSRHLASTASITPGRHYEISRKYTAVLRFRSCLFFNGSPCFVWLLCWMKTHRGKLFFLSL